MSKFLKRISPIISNQEVAIVAGRNFVNIPDLIEHFHTVFVYDTERPEIRARNLIPKIGFTDVRTLPTFNLLIIDEPCLWEIGNFTPLASIHRAGIVLVHHTPVGKKILKHLWQHNYENVEDHKSLHFWKKAN